MKIINLKKRRKIISKKEIIVIVVSISLSTLGIKAADNFFGEKIQDNENICEEGMVLVPSSSGDFCIDIYEASPGGDCPYLNPSNQDESRNNLDYSQCKAVSKKEVLPWRYISQNQAQIACARAGKRLATNKEWLQAAFGTVDTSSNWAEDDCQVNNNWENQPGKTGSGVNCVSSYGAYDMIGNVWEWVDETSHDGFYKDIELPSNGFIESVDADGIPAKTSEDNPDENYYNDYFWLKEKGVRGMARGGYWNNKDLAGQYSLYAVFEPSFSGPGIGFRCVK